MEQTILNTLKNRELLSDEERTSYYNLLNFVISWHYDDQTTWANFLAEAEKTSASLRPSTYQPVHVKTTTKKFISCCVTADRLIATNFIDAVEKLYEFVGGDRTLCSILLHERIKYNLQQELNPKVHQDFSPSMAMAVLFDETINALMKTLRPMIVVEVGIDCKAAMLVRFLQVAAAMNRAYSNLYCGVS